MNRLEVGKIIDSSIGVLQFELPLDHVVVWMDSEKPEVIICKHQSEIPPIWYKQFYNPWKVFGSFEKIKEVFPKFNIPLGSKVASFSSPVVIKIDFLQKTIQYQGIRQKRVVIVDDSPTMRKLLKFVIQSFEGWKVVAELENAESVPRAIEEFYPDIVTLDLHLGEKNGVQAMRESLAPKRIPTLVITSQPKADGSLVMDALEAGALDYLQKPESGNWDQLKDDLLFKMESSLKSKWQVRGPSINSPKLSIHSSTYNPEDFLILIGSSTGGTQALQEILTRLPPNIPPILITQHIPAGFSRALAERLNNLCPFEVKEAQEGDEIKAGRVLVAPGDHHLKISRNGKKVEIVDSDPVNRFRPSVDFMFKSVPEGFKRKVIATILTGMGKDGALGMLELKQKGALTIAQDEASSVVYGMPKEAARIGAADSIKPLLDIPKFWLDLMSKSHPKT